MTQGQTHGDEGEGDDRPDGHHHQYDFAALTVHGATHAPGHEGDRGVERRRPDHDDADHHVAVMRSGRHVVTRSVQGHDVVVARRSGRHRMGTLGQRRRSDHHQLVILPHAPRTTISRWTVVGRVAAPSGSSDRQSQHEGCQRPGFGQRNHLASKRSVLCCPRLPWRTGPTVTARRESTLKMCLPSALGLTPGDGKPSPDGRQTNQVRQVVPGQLRS